MRRAARSLGGAVVVIAATVVAAVGGAYAAMWAAGSLDQTESGWFWVFVVALPLGLAVGAAIGLYGSLWLASRWSSRQ